MDRSWAFKGTCRLLALSSGDESKRQEREMGLIIEVVMAVVIREGEVVKVDILTASTLEMCALS